MRPAQWSTCGLATQLVSWSLKELPCHGRARVGLGSARSGGVLELVSSRFAHRPRSNLNQALGSLGRYLALDELTHAWASSEELCLAVLLTLRALLPGAQAQDLVFRGQAWSRRALAGDRPGDCTAWRPKGGRVGVQARRRPTASAVGA